MNCATIQELAAATTHTRAKLYPSDRTLGVRHMFLSTNRFTSRSPEKHGLEIGDEMLVALIRMRKVEKKECDVLATCLPGT